MRAATALDAVRTQWERLEDQAHSENLPAMQILISKAQADSTLGQLYPFLSVGRLCFSRCIDYPYYVDVVISSLNQIGEKFVVQKTVGQGGWADTEQVREVKTADQAIRVVASLLPREYGSARVGSAEQWRKEFNDTAQRFRRILPVSDEH